MLLGGLNDEIHELNVAFVMHDDKRASANDVAQECWDVANFCMMIADRLSGQGQNRGRE